MDSNFLDCLRIFLGYQRLKSSHLSRHLLIVFIQKLLIVIVTFLSSTCFFDMGQFLLNLISIPSNFLSFLYLIPKFKHCCCQTLNLSLVFLSERFKVGNFILQALDIFSKNIFIFLKIINLCIQMFSLCLSFV